MYIRRTSFPVHLTVILPSPAKKPQEEKDIHDSQYCSSYIRQEDVPITNSSTSTTATSSSPTVRRYAFMLKTLLPTGQYNSIYLSTTLNVRRFSSGAGVGRRPTYTEISEACAVLGVEVDCDAKQLKKIYRDLVRKNHPDAGGDEATMSRITVAYERLNGLSKLEKEQFKLQRDAYRGGSYYTSAAASSSSSSGGGHGGSHYRTATGNPMYGHYSSGTRHGFYDTANSDYFRQGHANSHGHYTYQQRNRSYAENPFSATYPFSFNAQIQRAWSMSMGSILLRGFVMYLGISMILLLLYRKYRDWVHDDGWKMSESLARHEQLSEMHRIRQELNERIRAAREAAAAHNPTVQAVVSHGDINTDYNAMRNSKERELRALEYARRRQMSMSEEVRGWPQFGEEKGKLIRRAQDPPGVVFFEPRKEDHLQRQLLNLHRGRQWSERNQNAAEGKGNSRLSRETVTVPATDAEVAASTVSSASSNSSSNSNNKNNNTTAGVDADVLSAINAVFGGVWSGGQKTAGGS
ncbi:DnaJ domain [Trypanosoma melophagium]|uniref:DnaJ domain n=1 Tax=Trypanosoma melophagium TaxID=715481 RepID=UPI00351A69A1|nr:DnaJ domain [Trypanosoma melophagium]